jgi:outer membrane protein
MAEGSAPKTGRLPMHPRSLLLASLAILASASATQSQAVAPLKIGYINSAAILEEAPGAKEASAQFDQYLQGSQAEVTRMQQELQTLMADYDRQQLMLSPTAKTQRQEEIRRKQQEYQSRVDALESQAGQRQQQLVQPVMDKVNQVIEVIRAEGGYAFIFDVAAGSIIAADPKLDLTQQVIARLKAAPTPTPGPGQ